MLFPRHIKINLATSLLALGLGSAAQAEDQSLPTVDVTAEAVRADLKPDSPANPYRLPTSNRAGTETFTAEDIKKMQPKDVFDLLDKTTGITVTYQGRRNPFFVKERGGGSFTYIVDGAILPTVTQRILQRIPLAAIEEFKVVRDATALTLGPLIGVGASGGGDGLTTGYIIIRTRRPKADEVSIALSAEKTPGQYLAYKESLYGGKRLGAPAESSDLGGYVAGFASKLDRPSTTEWFDGQNGKSTMGSGGIGNDRASLNLVAFHESGRFEMQRGINPATGALDNSKWYYDPAETSVQSLSGTVNWNGDHTTLASVFKTRYDQKETNASFATATSTSSNYNEGTSGFDLKHNARFDNTYINLGGQRTHSWASGASGSTRNARWSSTVSGYGITAEQRLLDGQLALDAGYRRDSKHVDTTDTTVRMNNIDLPPAKATSLGGRWAVTPVYALNARYFDGKQGSASSSFSMLPAPGKTLDPETQKRKELALEGKFAPEIGVTFTWFDVYIQNQKSQTSTAYTYNGAQYYYYTQSNNQRSGNELLLRGNFAPRTSYKASWTHVYRNISSNASVARTNANNLYDFSVTHGWEEYTANFSIKRVDSYLGSNAAGPNGTGTGTPVMIGGYTRIDANLIRDFAYAGGTWSTTLYGRNLTNKQYVTQQGPTGLFPDRGRTLGVELKMDY